MKPDEKAMLEAVFEGHEGAFEALLDRYRALIYSVFYGPPFDFPNDYVDDLYQSFVIALTNRDYRKLRAFEGRNNCSLATFLQIVATRFALDERRKWIRHPRGRGLAGRDDDELTYEHEDPDAVRPDEPMLDQERLDTFHNLLFSLDWKRISAVLWVFKGITRETIAEVMATSRANIDALYKRAKDQMADLFAQGAGVSRTRQPDPAVLTPEVRAYLEALLPVSNKTIHEALLKPGAKRHALLGLVLAGYPRYMASKAEIDKLSGSRDAMPECLQVLEEMARHAGVAPGAPPPVGSLSDEQGGPVSPSHHDG